MKQIIVKRVKSLPEKKEVSFSDKDYENLRTTFAELICQMNRKPEYMKKYYFDRCVFGDYEGQFTAVWCIANSGENIVDGEEKAYFNALFKTGTDCLVMTGKDEFHAVNYEDAGDRKMIYELSFLDY